MAIIRWLFEQLFNITELQILEKIISDILIAEVLLIDAVVSAELVK